MDSWPELNDECLLRLGSEPCDELSQDIYDEMIERSILFVCLLLQLLQNFWIREVKTRELLFHDRASFRI